MSDLATQCSFQDHYLCVEFKSGSAECRQLEERYPGVRFNRVMVTIFALFRFANAPDEDYVEIWFNLSGAETALKRHGFDKPTYCGAKTRTLQGYRLSHTSYEDGLDRIAVVLVPALLAKFQTSGGAPS